jgi:N4-gp56 family major capsid protein
MLDSLLKGEVGTYYGVKTLLSHNILSFGSASSSAISGTAAAAYNSSTAPFLANIVLGDQAFGVPSLTGDSPYSPKVLIAEGPDKSDPLDLVTSVAVKTYYTAVRLNNAFYRVVFSRSEVS